MAVAASIDIILAAKVDKLDKGLQRAQGLMKGFAKNVAGLAFTYATVTKAASIFNARLEEAEQLANLSNLLNVSTDRLAGFRLQAELAGITLDDVSNSMVKLTKLVREAENGSASAERTLARFGLSLDALAGVAPGRQLEIIADKMASLTNHTDRIALAIALFGKRGAEMVEFLQDGSKGMADFEEKARSMGLTLDGVDVKKLTDEIDILKARWQGFTNQILVAIVPALNKITEAFNNWIEKIETAASWMELLKRLVTVEFTKGGLNQSVSGFIEQQPDPYAAMRDSEAHVAKMSQLETEAARIINQTRSPVEIFEQRMEQLQELFREGFIDFETIIRAEKQARADLEKLTLPGDFLGLGNLDDRLGSLVEGAQEMWGDATETFMDFFDMKSKEMETIAAPGAAEAGSAEAFSMIFGMQRAEQQQQVEMQRQANQLLTNIHEVLKKLKPAELLTLNF